MSTLRTAGGEVDDIIYECGCVLREVVIYAGGGGSSSSGGYVYISSPEAVFTSGPGTTIGGGAAGGGPNGGSGAAGGAGDGGGKNYTYPTPVAPVPTIKSIAPQMNWLSNTINHPRIRVFRGIVDNLIRNNQLSPSEVLKVGHAIQSVYIETVDAGLVGNVYGDRVGNQLDWQVSKLDVSLQKKLGVVYTAIGSSGVPTYQTTTQTAPVSMGGSRSTMNIRMKDMLRYAFLVSKGIIKGTRYTNSFFNFTNANANFSLVPGSKIANWQGTFDGVRIVVLYENYKFNDVELFFPGNPSHLRNDFSQGVVTKTATGAIVSEPYRIRMVGESNGSFVTMSSFNFNSRDLFYSWYVKYRTGK